MQIVLVANGTTKKYARTKTSDTANTALNPYDLADGSIGIYGIHEAGSTNLNKLVLITDAGSEAAGKVPAGTFVGDKIMIAVGTADSAVVSTELSRSGMKSFNKAYTAAVKGVTYVGYNAVTATGDISFPAVVSKNDEILLTANDVADDDNILRTGTPYSGYAAIDSAGEYDVLLDLLKHIDADSDRVFEADIIAKGTPTYIEASAATADPTLTNGSKVVTFAADPGIGVGDVLTIRGSIYKVAVENSATNYTLDREYKGSTETIDISATTGTVGTIASITNWGLKLTDKNVNTNVKYSISGLGVSAPIVVQTPSTPSSGAYQDVLNLEKAYRAYRGTLESVDRRVPVPAYLSVAGSTYDLYYIKGGNQGVEKGIQNLHNIDVNVILAVEPTADTTGLNQSDLEDILATTGFVSGFVSIV